MKLNFSFYQITLLMLGIPSYVWAENSLIEDFKSQPDTRWQFIADTVMGGVSTAEIEFTDLN